MAQIFKLKRKTAVMIRGRNVQDDVINPGGFSIDRNYNLYTGKYYCM